MSAATSATGSRRSAPTTDVAARVRDAAHPLSVVVATGAARSDAPVGAQSLLGPLPTLALDDLVALLEDAGLTGRGGAGFPTARKLAAVAAGGRAPVVVANAMEGEPLSHKDRWLLAEAPHLVLDGLEVLARSLGARRQLVAVGERLDPRPVQAAAEARPPGHGRTRRARPEVRYLDGGFVAGQESAVVRRLAGGPSLPSDPHVPVWARGLDGRPTLVVNAETLAHLALLARFGAAWFHAHGTPGDPGTFLTSLSATVPGLLEPGVREVARGTRLSDVLDRAGADPARVRAVLVGGYHGAWVDDLATPLDRASLAPVGATVGAGVLLALDVDTCPLEVTASIATYLAGQSARQCGPCLHGLPRLADTLARLARPGAEAGLVAEVERLRGLVVGRGACAHPDGTARLVASTMRVFGDHVDAHLEGRCR